MTEWSVRIMSASNNESEKGPLQPQTVPGPIGPASIVLGMFLSCFVAMTVMGNFLVIFAVCRERYLRTVTNYFIVSLATADLFMGTMVMPFAVFFEVTKGYWPFGQLWCDLWHALDVLSSTASILNLCMIALERFWATENPITYNSRMTKGRCLLMIILVWLCSSAISFPAIIWWRVVSTPTAAHYGCEFTNDSLYLVSSSIVSFYGPLIVMIVVYYRIYRTATSLIKSLNAGTKVIYKHGEVMVLRIHRGGGGGVNGSNGGLTESASFGNFPSAGGSCRRLISSVAANSPPMTTDSETEVPPNNNLHPSPRHSRLTGGRSSLQPGGHSCPASAHLLVDSDIRSTTTVDSPGGVADVIELSDDQAAGTNRSITRKLRHFAVGKRLGKFAREQKAAKTLGIVMGIFIICWLPFFVFNIVVAIDKTVLDGLKGKLAFAAVTWLGYINSSINPIIYAHSMRDFRRAFIRMLCSWYLRRRSAAAYFDKSNFRYVITPHTSMRKRSPHLTSSQSQYLSVV